MAYELPDFGVRRALLLQGPAGPFMLRFRNDLNDAGIEATKVNFHAGDRHFFPGPNALSYTGDVPSFGAWVERVMEERRIDGVFLFGDCRPLHRAAIEVAEERGARVYCFEEGYLRPDWITVQEHGVNGHSRMPKDPAFYRALDLPEPEPPIEVGPRFGILAWYSTQNALSFTLLNQRFRAYRHHRQLNAWMHTAWWVRGAVRKKRFERAERGMLERFQGPLSGRYFFVPLQVHIDYQLAHSPYDEVLDFVEDVLVAFREHAPPDTHILFKHHPMDRAYREYGHWFPERAKKHGLSDRVHYCHDVHLPTLLKHARGTITINSTVGLQSIFHGTPVKVLGDAVYDMPGLTAPEDLETFMRTQTPPDRALYEQFRRYLLRENQANGSFYRPLVPTERGTGVRWFPAPQRQPSRDEE
ncbi:MAG: capsule biosynthesis protein [Sandaracinaceae bacterium]